MYLYLQDSLLDTDFCYTLYTVFSMRCLNIIPIVEITLFAYYLLTKIATLLYEFWG